MNTGNPLLPYTSEQIKEYQKELYIIASLSNLYSDSKAPMIYYRATENIYCKAFNALNVSRADCTADAIFNLKTGVGIKTFLGKDTGSYQKIAEFNKQEPLYRSLSGIDLIKKIAEMRNERINFTMRNYGLNSMIYHCILRMNDSTISVYEEPMHRIDIDHIRITSNDSSNCRFTDGIEEYEFYHAKSTLLKYFAPKPAFLVFKANILADPMDILVKLIDLVPMSNPETIKYFSPLPSIVIPLYSENHKRGRFIGERSGLNQWNANGRPRDPNEIYIPFPIELRRAYPDFFPSREIPWDMELPNGEVISMKVCQENGKALMSNPNKALGKWLLRDVLNLPEGHVVTYEDLSVLGIDSIRIVKKESGIYSCDFIAKNNVEE